jgi:hypothetical protein
MPTSKSKSQKYTIKRRQIKIRLAIKSKNKSKNKSKKSLVLEKSKSWETPHETSTPPSKSKLIIDVFDSDITAQTTRVNVCLEKNAYDFVYVSLGSSFNEPFVMASKEGHHDLLSNAEYQMVPQFLRENRSDHPQILLDNRYCQRKKAVSHATYTPTSKHYLVIVLDDFNPDKIQKNIEILTRIITSQLEAGITMDIIILNHRITFESKDNIETVSITPFMKNLTRIPSNQLMVCNYVKFYNPNQLESKLDEVIDNTLEIILDKSTFFVWLALKENRRYFNIVLRKSVYTRLTIAVSGPSYLRLLSQESELQGSVDYSFLCNLDDNDEITKTSKQQKFTTLSRVFVENAAVID